MPTTRHPLSAEQIRPMLRRLEPLRGYPTEGFSAEGAQSMVDAIAETARSEEEARAWIEQIRREHGWFPPPSVFYDLAKQRDREERRDTSRGLGCRDCDWRGWHYVEVDGVKAVSRCRRLEPEPEARPDNVVSIESRRIAARLAEAAQEKAI